MSSRPAKILLGVDIGGSWLRAALNLPENRFMKRARRRMGPSSAPAEILLEMLSRWGLRRVDRMVLGTRGGWGPRRRRALARSLKPIARKVRVLPDLELARRAALGASPGVLLLAGTGSAALAENARRRRRRAGGLGPYLGDAGSGFWIGRQWLSRLPEQEALRFAYRADPVRDVASLAKKVLTAAYPPRGIRPQGQLTAREIACGAADELAALALRACAGLQWSGPIPLSWQGGLFANPGFLRNFKKRLDPRFDPRPPAQAPEICAASRSAGVC